MTVIVNFRTGNTIRWIFKNPFVAFYKARDMAQLEEVTSVYANGQLVTPR